MAVQVLCSNPSCRAPLSTSGADLSRASRCPRCEQNLVPASNSGTDAPESSSDVGGEPAAIPSPHSPVELAPGSTFGRYLIIRRLGQGGMGAVYLALDSSLNRQVALKIPLLSSSAGPEVLERFYREARAAAALDHPNLCPVHDIGELDGAPFLTMAYIDGKPLSEMIRPDQPWPLRQVATLVYKLALALQDAHQHGVVHRDLKPANILLGKRREIVVVDFGLAHHAGVDETRLTRAGEIKGTPSYMSPEQVAGDALAIGPGCDIYALGVILYELLTGDLPFKGPLTLVLAQILVAQPEPPSRHRANIPPQLEAICLKALAKRVSDRYPSMGDLAGALARYLRGSDSSDEILSAPGGTLSALPASSPAEAIASKLKRAAHVVAKLVARAARRTRSEARPGPVKAAPAPASGEWRGFRLRLRRLSKIAVVVILMIPVLGAIVSLAIDRLKRMGRSESGNETAIQVQRSARVVGGLSTDRVEPARLSQHERMAENARRVEYADRMDTVRSFLGSKNARGAEAALAACPEDLRNWEWFYCKRLCDLNLRPTTPEGRSEAGGPMFFDEEFVTLADTAAPASFAFRPGGSCLAMASWDGVVTILDPETGSVLDRSPDHANAPSPLAFAYSPDGTRIAMGNRDGSVRLWDANTLKKSLRVLRSPARNAGDRQAEVNAVAFSPDGRTVASAGNDGIVRIWSVDAEDPIREHRYASGQAVRDVLHGRDDLWIAGGEPIIQTWGSGRAQDAFTLPSGARSLAISPDGRMLASCLGSMISLWDMESRQLAVTMPARRDVTFLAFSPDGERLVTTNGDFDSYLDLWDVSTGRWLLALGERGSRSQGVTPVEFSPDGRRIAAPRATGLRIWSSSKP